MIWESCHWKLELLRIARKLHANASQKRWTARSDALLEKNVFVAAYAMRKLVEAHKLSQQVVDRSIPVIFYPLRSGQRTTHMNWHKIDEIYNLENPSRSHASVKHLCNQLIHSYVFVPMFDEMRRLSHLAVSSDHERNKRLLSVSLNDLISILVDIAGDEVVEAHYIWSDSKKDYIVINSSVPLECGTITTPDRTAPDVRS